MIETYLLALIPTVAAQAAPGPNLIAVASAALSNGRLPAVMVALGVASGVLIWVAAMAFGLTLLLNAYPVSLTLLKLLGGGYLLFLGVRALHAAWSGTPASIKTEDRPSAELVRCWRRGLLVVLTNPKAAMMWAAISAFMFGQGLSSAQVFGYAPVGALSAFIIYGCYGLLFSNRRVIAGYARATRTVETLLGGAFGLLGGKLLFDGLRELRG